MKEIRQHFSIRKLSIGAASVLIGVSLFGTTQNVHAGSLSDTKQTMNTDQAKQDSNNATQTLDLTKGISDSKAAQPKNANASVEYPENKDGVAQGNWFKIHVNSGDLTNVASGDTYKVQIGQNVPLNYDSSNITTPDFNVTNNGDGTFDLTAKSDYQTANFDINASMSYSEPLESDKTIDIPVTISHENQVLKSMTVPVNMTPAPKQPSAETHPVLYYRCYGNITGTDKIAWGVYVNYTKQELKDLDVTATFGGDQTLIPSSINVYLPTDIKQGVNQTKYPDDTYSYDLSANTQKDSNAQGLHLDDNTIKGYSDKPIYIYFQTQVPSYDGKTPEKYSSDLHLSAQGVTPINLTAHPASSGNSGGSDGSNELQDVTDKKTVTETINYLEKGTNKVLAPQYSADTTFSRSGKLNTVTNQATWDAWNKDSYTFNEVKSPKVTGYATDTETVTKQKVTPDSKNIIINVYYTKKESQSGPALVTPIKELDYRTVTQTVHFVYANGPKADQQAADPNVQDVTFTRVGTNDGKEITWGKWVPASQTFKNVNSPSIEGYTASENIVDGNRVKYDSQNIDITVYYEKTPEDIPDVPLTNDKPPVDTPDIPTDHTPNISEKEKPLTVVTITDKTPYAMSSPRMRGGVTAITPKKVIRKSVSKVSDITDKLPQTGSENTILPMIIGSLISMIGLTGIKRKKN